MSVPTKGGPWPKYSSGNQVIWTNYPGIVGKVIVLRTYGGQLAYDMEGHGTAVSQVAAGVPDPNSPIGTISGVAPAAWLGVYDVDSYLDGSYSDANILSALDDAASDGMDVINMSFGAPDLGGTADPANQTYMSIFDTLTQAGVILVCSAGNDGSDTNTMASPAELPEVIAAGAQQSTTYYGYAGVTATDGTDIAATTTDMLSIFVQPLTAPIVSAGQWDSTLEGCNSTKATSWPAPGGAAQGKIVMVERNAPTDTNPCTFVQKFTYAQQAGAAGIIVYNNPAEPDPDQLVYMDFSTAPVAIDSFPGVFIGYDDAQTLLANQTKAGGRYSVTLSFGFDTGDPRLVADFSSRGPDADLTIKPELIAVGNSIVAAICTTTGLYYGNNYCDSTGYTLWDGTSFSSPLIAGSAAVLKSARPGLTLSDYRSLLVNTASPMIDPHGTPWPVQTAGAGSLNLLGGMQSGVSASPATVSFGSSTLRSPVLQQTLTLKNLGSTSATFNLAIQSSSAALASLSAPTLSIQPGSTATVTVYAPGGTLAAGTYEGFITVTPVGSSSASARIPYWYAVQAKAPTRIAFDLSPMTASAGSASPLYVRFVDDAGLTFQAPGKIDIWLLSSNSTVASAPTYTPAYPAYSGTATDTVSFPNVYEIDITPSTFAATGDTATYRILVRRTGGGLRSDRPVTSRSS